MRTRQNAGIAVPRRLLCGLLLASACAISSNALALQVPGAAGIRVIPAEEVLRDHTIRLADDQLVFVDPGGARIRLITQIDDPEIRNPGDGNFHPANEAEVLNALRELPLSFVQSLRVDVFVLPYPRSGMLSSSADARAIYLTPGVLPYEASQIHFLVAHEVGHLVHRHFLPDTDRQAWAEWASLRGVADTTVFNNRAAHANRPREIFAEDFRVLFGGALARGDGSIENPRIAHPENVPGLRAWYVAMAETVELFAEAEWRVYPNPITPGQRISLLGPADGASGLITAGLFDVSGRRVAGLELQSGSRGWETRIGESGADGRELSTGVYWIRLETGPAQGTRALPLRVIR